MPKIDDEQILAALGENDHDDIAEALTAKLDEDPDTDEQPTKATKAPGGGTLGGALRRAAGGG